MTRSAFDAALFALCWFFALYLVWIPLDIVTDRLSFVYYFYPAVGAVCIGVAIGLSRLIDFWRARSTSPSVAETQAKTSGPLLSKRRTALRWLALILAALFLAAHLAVFFILSPLTGSYYFT